MTTIRSDITVVGAGVVGLAACLALSQAGFRICLVSREPPPRPPGQPGTDPRVFALSTASVQMLGALGVHQLMDASRIGAVRSMCVYPSSAPLAEPIRFAETANEGHPPLLAEIAEQSNILAALQARVDESGERHIRQVHGNLNAISMSERGDYIGLELSGGESVQTRLLLGADGAASAVRAMAGIAVAKKSYGQTAIVAHLRCEHSHTECAYQWFGEHGVLALLPLPADDPADVGHLASMVWSTDSENAARVIAAGPAALSSELAEICAASRGSCEARSGLHSFDLVSQQAQSLIGGRIALIGDAAHVVHPLAGQGLNLGLDDVAVLSALLGQARKRWRRAGFDPGASLLLRRYRRHRAEPLLAMQTAIDGLQRLFASPPNRPEAPYERSIATARDIGWQFVARNAAIRRQLIRYAAGGS